MKNRKPYPVIALLMILIPLIARDSTNAGYPVPDTGQTKCYDMEGEEIICPAEPICYDAQDSIVDCSDLNSVRYNLYGQDANYTINPRSFTKLGGNGEDLADSAPLWAMVRDNVTGLVWEVKTLDGSVHDMTNNYAWYDPDSETNGGNPGSPNDGDNTSDFINSLNMERFGTFTDWRPPDVNELQSLLNLDVIPGNNVLNYKAYFPYSDGYCYFTDQTAAQSADKTISLDFYAGNSAVNDKNSGFLCAARAVRSEKKLKTNHLIINNDGTVTDLNSGLMWQRGPAGGSDAMNWMDALAFCEFLGLADFNDWRLPNLNELMSIVDWNAFAPAINAACFPETVSSPYWTSTTFALFSGVHAHFVNFETGRNDLVMILKTDLKYVRAVRGGQNQIPGGLLITSPDQASTWSAGSTMPIIWDTRNLGGTVDIQLYRQGGKSAETPEDIAIGVPNNGYYEWTVDGTASVNCMLKITPSVDENKSTSQGLFMIGDYVPITPPKLTVSEPVNGVPQTAAFNIKLISEPTGTITVDLQSSNPGECSVSPVSVSLNSANWDSGETVTVTGVKDEIIDGSQQCKIITSSTKSSDGYFDAVHIANIHVTVQDAYTDVAIFSVYPAYGTENNPMTIDIEGAGFVDGQTSLWLIPEFGDDYLINHAVNDQNSIAATLPGLYKGNYGLRVTGADGYHELQNAITITDSTTISQQNQKKAIIIAGGGPYVAEVKPGEHVYPYNQLWDATKKCADMAFFSLYSQGYSKDNILYLSHDTDSSDVDGEANLENITDAFNTWARTPNPASELIVYLVGPGSGGTFIAKYGWKHEILTAAELGGLLDNLQTVSPAMTGNIIVVYDACMSGAFLPVLKGDKRIIITGTSGNERAWFLDDGEISFSYLFWRNIFTTGKVDQSFTAAKNGIGAVQTPLIDSNGDGLPDSGKKRIDTAIEIGRGRQVESTPPTITSVTSDPSTLNGDTESTITAEGVQAQNEISRVWARVVPPDEQLESNDKPVLVVPTCPLGGSGTTFQNSFGDFSFKGYYSVFVYAKDRLDFQSLPKITGVTQRNGESIPLNPQLNINCDATIDLLDLIIMLKAVVGKDIGDLICPDYQAPAYDLDGNFNIGLPEAVNLMRVISG